MNTIDRTEILAWDGRLDNRDELISELHSDLEAEPTDVAIVSAAFMIAMGIIIASAKAYVNAINRLEVPISAHPQRTFEPVP